jgi:hypothetical protein
MYQFLLNCDALLEVHIRQAAFIPDTEAGITSQQPIHGHYKNHR